MSDTKPTSQSQLPEPEKIPERKAAVLASLHEFYTPGMAEVFLYERQSLLGNQRPVEMLRTETGFREVMAMLERLRDGAYI